MRTPHHAHRVFTVAKLGVADEADQAVLHVLDATGEIDDGVVVDVVVQRVDGEVAADRIGLQRAVLVVTQDAASLVALVAVGDGATEGGDLDDLVAVAHMGNDEAPADEARIAEHATDLLRVRIGGNVEILGLDARQDVAHCAAHQVRLEAGIAQAIKHLDCSLGDELARDGVVFARYAADLQGW